MEFPARSIVALAVSSTNETPFWMVSLVSSTPFFVMSLTTSTPDLMVSPATVMPDSRVFPVRSTVEFAVDPTNDTPFLTVPVARSSDLFIVFSARFVVSLIIEADVLTMGFVILDMF